MLLKSRLKPAEKEELLGDGDHRLKPAAIIATDLWKMPRRGDETATG
jgi:hypothetical protein